MQKKMYLVLLVASLSLGMAQVTQAGSGPRLTVKDMYQAALKGKQGEFNSELTGDALEKYGNADGMAIFAKEAKGFKKIDPKDKTLLKEDNDVRLYEVAVHGYDAQGNETIVRKPKTSCKVSLETRIDPGTCGKYFCRPDRTYTVEVEDCAVLSVD